MSKAAVAYNLRRLAVIETENALVAPALSTKRQKVWSCFTAKGVGNLYHIKGIIDQKMYKQILIHHMRPSMMKLGGKETIFFQQDNDPKHTAKTVKDYTKRAKYLVLDNWPTQSPDLNPTENFWKDERPPSTHQ